MALNLPVNPPVAPMLAKATSGLPVGDGLIYEPKWDGFRCIAFRDGDEVVLGSRNERPLTRYFPEVVEALRANVPERSVIDGEIIIAGDEGLDFDSLTQRIHPADSRVKRLAEETPASFVAFDLLALGDADLRSVAFSERRARLENALSDAREPVHVTPATRELDLAQKWFEKFEGAGLDGIVVKAESLLYVENKRVMLKVKHERTADCVVAGFRWHKSGGVVGSLLLGLFDDDATLHHVGVTASFTMDRRRELVSLIEPYRMETLDGHPWQAWFGEAEVTSRNEPGPGEPGPGEPGYSKSGSRKPGAASRWNAKKDLTWEPLRAELVCEVAYDHLQGDRFRHATTFKRWREDRDSKSCTYAQLESPESLPLSEVFDH